MDQIGSDAFQHSSDFRLSEWLAAQEDNHRIVLYQCDPDLTHWTKLCLRHADVVFMLADPKDDNGIKPLERDLEALSRRTRKEMIFLHSEDTKYPEGTADWLKGRNWINAHYHIKCPRRMSSRKTKYTKILNNGPHPDVHSDFSRLSRYITGTDWSKMYKHIRTFWISGISFSLDIFKDFKRHNNKRNSSR